MKQLYVEIYDNYELSFMKDTEKVLHDVDAFLEGLGIPTSDSLHHEFDISDEDYLIFKLKFL